MKVKAVTHVRLFAWPEDWEATKLFYADTLGLPLVFTDDSGGVVMFKIEGVNLLLERLDRKDEESAGLVGRFAGVSFRVDDAAAACALLEQRGLTVTGAPEKQPWGDTLVHVKDPAGNVITLIEFG